MSSRLDLVLGGTKSGKTRYGMELAQQSGLDVVYIATAQARDEEMIRRIEKHKLQRPADWVVIEEPIGLSRILMNRQMTGMCLIVDCLTLWLSNLFEMEALEREQEISNFLKSLQVFQGRVILVSNETNLGIIPLGELSRQFCDEAGVLHQKLGSICHSVTLMVAGLPLLVKGK